jgi:hypothetical protein
MAIWPPRQVPVRKVSRPNEGDRAIIGARRMVREWRKKLIPDVKGVTCRTAYPH